jgi:glycine/D-amino acid oxidase-like deaminating enzyme
MTSPTPERVVIAGGGIIGVSTAYFLAKNHGIESTIVDPVGIAPAASGKAGGFLAKDWNDHSPTMELTRRSFELHAELADEFGPDSIQYRRLTCAAIAVDPSNRRRPKGKKLEGVEWASQDSSSVRPLGTTETIAQVHPKLLCQRLWSEAEKEGCKLIAGRKVVDVHRNEGKIISGAILDDGSIVECDAILFACGPWTANIMKGVKYHSVVVKTNRVLNQCVFFSGRFGDPEVYVRGDSTAYCTGFPEPPRVVEENPGQEIVQPEKISTILEAVALASEQHNCALALDQDPVVQQACYLPTTDDGIPVMGKLEDGCFIAAGHSCWGILLGPASGESMASLIATGDVENHVDLRPFSPSRYQSMKLVSSVIS